MNDELELKHIDGELIPCEECARMIALERERLEEGQEIANRVADYVNRQMRTPTAFVEGMKSAASHLTTGIHRDGGGVDRTSGPIEGRGI